MIIADIIRERQPKVYNALIDVFELADIEVQQQPIRHVIQPEFPEEDREFTEYKGIMEQRKAVEL